MQAPTKPDPIERARSMFEFLRDVQKLRVVTPRTIDQYGRAGGFALLERDLRSPGDSVALELPALEGDWDLTRPIVVVPRRPESRPPNPPRGVAAFLRTDQGKGLDEPTAHVVVAQDLLDAEAEGTTSAQLQERLAGATPEQMVIATEGYLTRWEAWASTERHDRAIRQLYKELFRAHEAAANDPHTWEFVLGLGRARIPQGDNRDAVDRPLLVAPLVARSRRGDGALELHLVAETSFAVETDMFAPDDLTGQDARHALESALSNLDPTELIRATTEQLIREFVNRGLMDFRFVEDQQLQRDPGAVVAIGPMVILRKRSQAATIRALDQVVRYLATAEELPPGLEPIVELSSTSQHPKVDQHDPDGAVVTRGDEHFTPLPVNERQWNVIRRADSRPLTLVQGPPGTGKTHTTAALISHLLAQGKRILVTAHNPGALGEVKAKLPSEIQSLAVSVTGAGQQEMADLRRAIDSLSRRAGDFDRDENTEAITATLAEIQDELDARDALLARLVESRKRESEAQSTPFGNLTLAELALGWRAGVGQFEWAREVLPDPRTAPAELGLGEVPTLQSALAALRADVRLDAALNLLGAVADVPAADEIEQLLSEQEELTREVAGLEPRADRRVLTQAASVPSETINAVESHVQGLLELVQNLRARPESWVELAVREISVGRTRSWQQRRVDVERRIALAHDHHRQLQPHQPITISGDAQQVRSRIATILTWLDTGAQVRLDGAGRPKAGLRLPRAVKDAWPVWSDVTIRGRAAAERSALETVSLHFELEDELGGLDQAWPAGTPVSTEDSHAERLAWHEDELGVLSAVLGLSSVVEVTKSAVESLPGAYPMDWTNEESLSGFLDGLTLILTRRSLDRAHDALESSASRAFAMGQGSLVTSLRDAIAFGDADGYRAAHGRLVSHLELRDKWNQYNDRLSELRSRLPQLAGLLPIESNSEWLDRLGRLDEAWHWLRVDDWLTHQEDLDPNALQSRISQHEDRLRELIGELAALRAWGKAVERLTPDRRADLQAYVTLVRRLGRGTGKFANKQRAEIQSVLNRCRASVPVWVMPLYRVFDGIEMRPDSFDVIIIDEASQASLESLVLQFLAPKVVVVGDDKQVSPSAVGLDQRPVHNLADAYLGWSPQKAVYKDPTHSLFDEARMRFPDLITLTEHRRSVPEIIGFSNEIVYHPDGVPLTPVRETGASALPPLKLTVVPDGEILTNKDGRPAAKKVNRPEQEAIVNELKRCLGEPAYEGKTMGVISLLGSDQSKQIMDRLIEEIDPQEIVDRDIRCGEAPEFQGAERDVIFLSMVAAPNAPFAALTATPYVQRFNVAVSRARDQIHLFHSLDPANPALKLNPEDLRTRLISYIARRSVGPGELARASLPTDQLDHRLPTPLVLSVYNTLARHGYHVEPKYKALGRRIDLVVVGTNGKAAVQCVGSSRLEEDEHRRVLRHEADLQRVGWKVHRVRESSLAISPDLVEAELLRFLQAADVQPVEVS